LKVNEITQIDVYRSSFKELNLLGIKIIFYLFNDIIKKS